MGHEFVAEILEYGPGTEGTLPVGSLVCSMPFTMGPGGIELVGYSPTSPGGYGERMVLQEAALIPVPEGLAPRLAALTEPLAVGEHAVSLADVQPGWPCHVVGCGPIGLAIIWALKARGVGRVVAADFSPARRALAQRLGADVVLDAEGTGFRISRKWAFPPIPWSGRRLPVSVPNRPVLWCSRRSEFPVSSIPSVGRSRPRPGSSSSGCACRPIGSNRPSPL